MPLIRVRDDGAKLNKRKRLIKFGVSVALVTSAALYHWWPGLAVYVGLVPVALLSTHNFLRGD